MSKAEKENLMENRTIELSADLVIIGAGAGGLSAAAAACLAGVKRIIVLEKQTFPGGNSLMPKAPVSRMHMDLSDPAEENMYRNFYDPDTRFKTLTEWTHGMSDASLVRVLADKEADNVEWLNSLRPARDDGSPKLPDILVPWLKAQGVEILCSAAVSEMCMDEGRFCGVKAIGKDSCLDIVADHAVIACGGFLGSMSHMRRYFPYYRADLTDRLARISFQNSGDGIRLAEQCGGDISAHTAFEIKSACNVLRIESAINPHNRPEVIWVNKFGQRFVSETDETARIAQFDQPDMESFVLFDAAVFRRILQRPDSSRLTKFFQALIDAGRIFRRSTAFELATAIGCPPEQLELTLKTYNVFCEDGKDAQFGKAQQGLHALRTPPFYAIPVTPGIICTHGPLRVDTEMRLLDKQRRPIGGVFAAGVDIGNTDVDVYCATCSGHSLGWSIASGRIAGEQAAKEILKTYPRKGVTKWQKNSMQKAPVTKGI